MPHRSNVIRANILRGFGDFIEKRGVASDPLLKQAGLQKPYSEDFERELPFDRVAQLMEQAAVACGEPNFGLAYAKAYPVGGMGLFAFLFLNSNTVEEALRTVVRFVPLLKIPFKFSFDKEGDDGRIPGGPQTKCRPIISKSTPSAQRC